MPQLDLSKLPDQPKLDLSQLPDKEETIPEPAQEPVSKFRENVQTTSPSTVGESIWNTAKKGWDWATTPLMNITEPTTEEWVKSPSSSATRSALSQATSPLGLLGEFGAGIGMASRFLRGGKKLLQGADEIGEIVNAENKLIDKGNLNISDKIKSNLPAEIQNAPSKFKVNKPTFTRIGENEKGVIYRNNETGEEIIQPASKFNPAVTPPPPIQPSRLPRDLQGAKPRYNIGSNSYNPQFESDIDKALFIIAQDKPSLRNDDYLKFVMQATGLDENTAKLLGRDIRNQIKTALKSSEPGDVKIPTLWKPKVEAPLPARDMRFPSNEGPLTPDAPVVSKFGQKKEPYPAVKNLEELAMEGERRLQASKGNIPPTVPPNNIPPSNIPPIPPSDPNSFMRAIEDDGIILTGMNLLKGAKATGDFGPMFRQGIAYAGRPAWFKAFKQQFKSYYSEGGHKLFQSEVKANPLMQPQFQIGKAAANNPPKSWVEMAGLDINKIEDAMQGVNLIEKTPVFGRAARASNRAYNDSITSLRLNMADVIRAQYKKLQASMAKTGASAEELANFDPDNPIVAKRIGDEINTATGRGSLKIGEGKKPIRDDKGSITGYKDRWSGEKSADILNAAMFSPRLFSARLKTIKRLTWDSYMNPFSKADPIERREHLKQLLSIAGAATTLGTAYEMFGAESDISIQALMRMQSPTPTSSDFGKSRFGKNITIDNTGGIGRFGTLGTRIGTQSTTSGRTGRNFELGINPVIGDGEKVFIDFIKGNASPAISLALTLMKQKEFGGKKANWTTLDPFENTAIKAAMPMIYEDLYEILKEDPSYIALIVPAALGSGLNVYEDPKRPKQPLLKQMGVY